jgi:3,4-dihydroxy 2-butanone 4-phosphate synthase/GTP cyclohydrolase II
MSEKITELRRYSKEDYAYLSSTDEILEEARNGRMFILVDSEDRENEGDLVIPAQMATPEIINFMITHARGLVCLAMTQERVHDLGLDLMPAHNQSAAQTAFTYSIEAREGVTTGISARDRAHTIAVAIDPSKGYEDISGPGHIFPLAARPGGVLVRAGHTEAIVDVARLAGLNPSGVICEIIKEDGDMARLPDLIKFAQRHNLKIGAISDLIAYRRKKDNLLRRHSERRFTSRYGGEFQMRIYENTCDGTYHAALVKGDITDGKPVLTRMHVASVAQDMLGEDSVRSGLLKKSMELIAEEMRGVLVLLHPDRSPLFAKQQANRLVEFGSGAQILIDLGVKKMTLLSDTDFKIPGLEGYGLEIVGRRSIFGDDK